jgi:hypothetical protein
VVQAAAGFQSCCVLDIFGPLRLGTNVRQQLDFPVMGFVSELFKKGEEPQQSYTDGVLGPMAWSQDDEAWFGQYRGQKFSRAYERTNVPPDSLISYAREVLNDAGWLASSLAQAKEIAKRDCGDPYLAEVAALTLGRIHFYLHKGKRRIIADLDGGKDVRRWRIEYADRVCEGIGFDR